MICAIVWYTVDGVRNVRTSIPDLAGPAKFVHVTRIYLGSVEPGNQLVVSMDLSKTGITKYIIVM